MEITGAIGKLLFFSSPSLIKVWLSLHLNFHLLLLLLFQATTSGETRWWLLCCTISLNPFWTNEHLRTSNFRPQLLFFLFSRHSNPYFLQKKSYTRENAICFKNQKKITSKLCVNKKMKSFHYNKLEPGYFQCDYIAKQKLYIVVTNKILYYVLACLLALY